MLTTNDVPFLTFVIRVNIEASGWPKKRIPIVGSKVVPGLIVASACIDLLIISIGIGVGRRYRAAQLLTQLLSNRDWDKYPVSTLIANQDPVREIGISPDIFPWDVLGKKEVELIKRQDMIPWSFMPELMQSGVSGAHSWPQYQSQALLYGLLHPDDARACFIKWRAVEMDATRAMAQYGVQKMAGGTASEEDTLNNYIDQLFEGYEQVYGKLAPPAQPVLHSFDVSGA
ncbi:MAG: hypothetical protein WCC11_08130 [Gammaproteobacteria bacterium]